MKSGLSTIGFGDADALIRVLGPWQGGRAQVIEYNCSHSQLSIWITKPQSDWVIGPSLPGGIVLQCSRCVLVRFVPVWGPIRVDVGGLARDGDRESLRLNDGESFEVTCWDAQVTGIFDDFTELFQWQQG